MPNTINLRLLDNKNIIAELNGIPLANENSYKIIAGEENATIFRIASKPNQYINARYTVEMVNSQGYGFQEVDIVDNSFVLPKGMAVAGYGLMKIRAYQGEEIVPFANLKIKVQNTLPDWQQYIVDAGKIVQEKGTATDKVMSQAATTQELNNLQNEKLGKSSIDSALLSTSTNPVQNKVITEALRGKQDTLTFDTEPKRGSANPVTSGGVYNLVENKNKIYVLSYNTRFTSGAIQKLYDASGTEITSLIGQGNYIDENCRNKSFNTEFSVAFVGSDTKYLIFRNTREANSYVAYSINELKQRLIVGDIVVENVNSQSFYWAQGRFAPFNVQHKLESGVNIKTINNQSILGAGNINIEGGGGSGEAIVVDGELSNTSTNPVENKVITGAIQQLSQAINTKPTTFTVSVNDTFSNGVEGAKWFDYEGNDITLQIGTGDYVDSNCRNDLFNSQETSVSIIPYRSSEYIIAREPVVNTPIDIDIKYVVITATQLLNIENKVIRIVEQEIPDRTAQLGGYYYKTKGITNLTFDDSPVSGSSNPVKSSGIFNSIQNVREVAEGKTKTYILSYNDTFSNGWENAKWVDYQGNDITSQIGTGDYIDANCLNSQFNSQELRLTLSTSESLIDYIIFRLPQNSYQSILTAPTYLVVNSIFFGLSIAKSGDNIYIIETNVPNRWFVQGLDFFALGTQNDNLTIDTSLSLYSTNPVENSVITKALDDKQAQIRQLSQVLNTKPTTFTISVNDTFSNGEEGAQWFDYEGNIITSQIGEGDYIDSNCRNSMFNSQETSVSIIPNPTQMTFIIARRPQTTIGIEYVVLTVATLGSINNKIIRIVEQNIPDRSGQGNGIYYEVKGALNDYSRYGTYTVPVNSWEDATVVSETYTHAALVAIGSVLTINEIENKNCVLTLFNNDPELFAKHGFSFQSAYNANGVATARVLSIGVPTENITFSFKGEVIE